MIQPGTMLQNRYRVAEQIGKGGMGEVYLATDERFQSMVAIKRTFYEDPEMLKAFEREARLLNRLRHAVLPKVSDHFSESGGQFLVMEFIEGSDFAELMKERNAPFPLADVLRWADELLDALDYLHTQEPPVVHRDIKPPNIKLTPRGKIVLLDFGLAKGAPSQTASGMASSVSGYSLNFAPLEQMDGSGTDPRSDIYSLAATLYFLLTGACAPDAVARAVAAVKGKADPLRPVHMVQPQVPAAVGQILQRAMSQNSALRYASAAELRAALSLVANDIARREARQPAKAAKVLPQSLPAANAAAPAQLRGTDRPAAQSLHQVAPSSQTLRDSFSSHGSGDDTVIDSREPLQLSDSYTVIARADSPHSGATAKRSFGLIACILVVCAVAGAFLLTRASGSSSTDAGANNEAQSSAPEYQQISPAEASKPAIGTMSSDSTRDAPNTDATAQSAPSRSAGEMPSSSNPQVAAEPAVKTDASGMGAKVDSATPYTANDATAASSNGRPGLVIQNPAPAPNPASEARRIEDARREQSASRPDYGERPPPGGYPPPPDGRRPPPPDGRRPPPPQRRPLYP